MFDRYQLATFVAVAVLLVAISGGFPLFVDMDTSNESEPDQLITEISTEHPDSFEGRIIETVERNGTTLERTTYEVVDKSNKTERRVEITNDDGSAITLVRNNDSAWIYNVTDDEFIETNVTDDNPGFIVPVLQMDYYDDLPARFDPEYVGVERVADRETHVIVLNDPAAEETSASLDVLIGDSEYRLAEAQFEEPLVLSEYRLWIDREYAHPLKEQITLEGDDGESVVFTDRYERIDFETDPDKEQFVFDPPAGAEVDDSLSEIDSTFYDSIAEADAETSTIVPDPTVPKEYELEEVYVSQLDSEERISLRYRNGDQQLNVRIWPESDRTTRGSEIEINGQPGVIVESHGETTVNWECADRRYTVSSVRSAEELLEIAESIDCPPSAES